MRIGIGTKVEEGKFAFTVVAPFMPAAQISMERSEKQGENQPRYLFLCGGERCGAMWKRTPKGGGETYLSGIIESPVFPGGKIEVAAFVAKEAAHQMDLVWSPSRAQERTGTAPAVDEGDDIPF